MILHLSTLYCTELYFNVLHYPTTTYWAGNCAVLEQSQQNEDSLYSTDSTYAVMDHIILSWRPLYSTPLYSFILALQYSTVQFYTGSTVLHCTVLYLLYSTPLYRFILALQYSTVRFYTGSTVLNCTVLYLLYSTPLYSFILALQYSTVQFYTGSTVLHCTVLYWLYSIKLYSGVL